MALLTTQQFVNYHVGYVTISIIFMLFYEDDIAICNM